MTTVHCSNCGAVVSQACPKCRNYLVNSDGICPSCGYVGAKSTPSNPQREWVPVSQKPEKFDRYAANIGGMKKMLEWNARGWCYTDGRQCLEKNFTHWCAFPPLPTPKSKFDTWWESLPLVAGKDVCELPDGTYISFRQAKQAFEAGQAAGGER